MFGKSAFQLFTMPTSLRDRSCGDPDADEATTVCTDWLSRHADQRRLLERWDKLEAFLMHEYNLFELSEQDRAVFFEATPLEIIGDRIDELHALKIKLLDLVSKSQATTTRGLTSKLLVALALAHPDENRDVHILLRSIVNDIDPSVLTNGLPHEYWPGN